MQDTGLIQGITEAPQSISFDAMAERQQALADVDPEGPRRRQPVLLHRRRRHQHHAQQRPLPDQPEAARRAQRRRHRRSSARLQRETARRRRHHALSAAGAGPDHRRHRQPHPVPVHPARTPTRRSSTTWVPKLVEQAAARRRSSRDVASDLSDQRPVGLSSTIDRDTAGALRHHAGDHRQRALRRLRPAHHLDHLHPVEPVPRDPGGRSEPAELARLAGRRSICRPRPAAARCRCRSIAKVERADRAAADRSSRPVPRRPPCPSTWRRALRSARRSTRSSRRKPRSACRASIIDHASRARRSPSSRRCATSCC